MKICVIGTGMVGQTVSSKLSSLGHDVEMATRNSQETANRDTVNQMTGYSFKQWKEEHPKINLINYSEVSNDNELFINATGGMVSIEALNLVGVEKMHSKTLIDISNPLDFSNGMPPTLSVCNDDSLGERIQAEFPSVRVVKSLNTMTTMIMMNPKMIDGDHNVFMSSNFDDAKEEVRSLLLQIGWKGNSIIDLGDISTARGAEMLLPLWLRLWGALGTAEFNFHIAKN